RARSLHRLRHRQGARGHDLGRERRRRRRRHIHGPAAPARGAGEVNMARILIVDDDPSLLKALPEAVRLRLKGVEVDTCDSATEAIDRIRVIDYDAIVADIKMPGMDGLALLAEIR